MMDDPVLFRHLDALQPGWKSLRHVLLPETLGADPLRIALHRQRPSAQLRHDDRRHRLVIGGQIALRDAVLREQHFVRMRDHDCSLTTWSPALAGYSRTMSFACLSKRTPSKRGWRSLSFPVHSMKPTCTTISGRTQCARRRGRPTAFVNGGCEVSSASSRVRRFSSSFVSKPVPIFPAKTRSSPS